MIFKSVWGSGCGVWGLEQDHAWKRVRRIIDTLQKCAAVPTRARIQGAQTSVSLISRRERNKEEEKVRRSAASCSRDAAGSN